MAAPTILSGFLEQLIALQATSSDAEAAFTKSALQLDSHQSVVELLHIQVLAKFEAFVAELFYDCVLGSSGLADVVPILSLSTSDEVDLMVYAEGRRKEKYLTWLPFHQTLGRAETYLAEGNPFTRLKYRPVELEVLGDAMTVRNAIAHSSPHSHAQFVKLATARSYPSARPADYLLSTRGTATEAVLLFAALRLIAEALAAVDHQTANALLNPERPFSGDAPGTPPGLYECASCATQKIGHTGGKLGPCPKCGRGSPCTHCGRAQGAAQWRRIL